MGAIIGDVNVMTSMLFGGVSPGMRDLINREHEQFSMGASAGWSQTMAQRVSHLFQSYNGSEAMQMVQNALNQVNSASMPDVVYEFKTIEQFQTAQPLMQEYIMANQVVRKAYHAGLCDGYSDTYVDKQPEVIGAGHRPFEHVTDGLVQFKDDGSYELTNYSSAWVSETTHVLSIEKKAAILNTWSALERFFDEGDRDPTSPWNTSL